MNLLVAALLLTSVPEWIEQRPITWNAERDRLTRAYRAAHYGETEATSTIDPTMIVVHHTAIDTLDGSFRAFDAVRLPGSRRKIGKVSPLNVSVHFLVDQDGHVFQLMPETRMGRHVIGLNHAAIGIENVGGKKKRLTSAQVEANAKLVRYLKRKFPKIDLLLGHHEYAALEGTPRWKERDPTYRTKKQDPGPRFMRALRARLRDLRLSRP